ncbi:hypothetical protein JB92DRAFT_3066534 [Gautieria morchelliformis]|nr:hypothetical protein JB92DRAFT_3066534 [Gautieria morchelliformis]
MPLTRSTALQGVCVSVVVAMVVSKKVRPSERDSKYQPRKQRKSYIRSNTSRPLRALELATLESLSHASSVEADGKYSSVEQRGLKLLHATSVEERRVLYIYCLHSWESHLSKCIPTQNTNSRQATKVDGKIKAERSKHRTEAERAEALRNDPRTILCGMCGVWIKLRNNTTYCATPWLVHAKRCRLRLEGICPSDTVPSTSAVPGKAP